MSSENIMLPRPLYSELRKLVLSVICSYTFPYIKKILSTKVKRVS